jgi:hypothetical protein
MAYGTVVPLGPVIAVLLAELRVDSGRLALMDERRSRALVPSRGQHEREQVQAQHSDAEPPESRAHSAGGEMHGLFQVRSYCNTVTRDPDHYQFPRASQVLS